MLTDVFGNSAVARVLDRLLYYHVEFSQIRVCSEAKVSRPSIVRVFKRLLRNGFIEKKGRKYAVVWGSSDNPSPMDAVMKLSLLSMKKENNRIAREQISKETITPALPAPTTPTVMIPTVFG